MMRSYTDRCALLAIEVTYGVAPALAAANAILLRNSQIQPAADKLERNNDKPYFSGNPFVMVGKRVTLTGETDILGAAIAGNAAPLGALYRTCGHAEVLDAGVSATYSPISRNFASASIDFFIGGIKFRMLGVRGSIDQDYTVKQYAKGTVNLTGLLTIPTDAEAPAGIDWTAFQTPAAIETETWEVTVGGVNVCAQQLTLQANATVTVIECSEGREVAITNRTPGGVLRVWKDSTLATWNPWSIAETQAIVPILQTITATGGRSVEVPIRAQLELPRPVEIEGQLGYEIPYTAVATGAGGDEYSITFT